MEEDRMGQALRRIVRGLGVLDGDAPCCPGVTLAQCHVLTEVCGTPGTSLGELADRLGLDKSTVSRTVEALVARGLLDRQPRRENRRCVTLLPTPSGEGLGAELEAMRRRLYGDLLDRVPEARRTQVLEGLDLLAEALEAQGATPFRGNEGQPAPKSMDQKGRCVP